MASGVTIEALSRLSHLPDNPNNPAELIAAQRYYDVEFTGGSISGITPSDLPTPLAIEDGGTGQITANDALNALLPSQTGNSGKVLKTDGANTSWSTDTDTGITQLTGDVTAGPGSGSQVATLATVNSNVGSFGSSTAIPAFTVNGKGLITAASTNAVVAPAGTLTGTALASNVVTSSLTSVGTLSGLTMGGTLAMGANDITMTGSLGTTGARLTKGWFTDLQVTNAISGSITGNAATVTTNANLTGAITSTGNATSLGSFSSANLAAALTDETGTGANVFAGSPTFTGTPVLAAPTATTFVVGNSTNIIAQGILSIQYSGAANQAFNTNETTAAGSYTVAQFRSNGSTVGSITGTTSATAFNTSSDYRLKENVEPLTEAIPRLKQLSPIRHNWKAEPAGPKIDGFLAHEVKQVVPNAVYGEKDAVDAQGEPMIQQLDHSKLVPLLVASVLELVARVEAVEGV